MVGLGSAAMKNARSPLLIQQARQVLRTRGYSGPLSWDETAALFGEYVGYYFAGLTTRAFLCALADELLIRLTKQTDGQPPTDRLLDVLIAASTAPSISSHREHAQYLKTLEQFLMRKEVKKICQIEKEVLLMQGRS